MSGTRIGGIRAAKRNIELYGPDFYKTIGAKGGKNGRSGGFASSLMCNCDLFAGTHKYARCSGIKGGRVSRRTVNA